MKETFYHVVIREQNLGHGRIVKQVVDVETGEILGRWHEIDTAELFPQGCHVVVREVMLVREQFPNGAEKIYVCTPEGGAEKGIYFEKTFSADDVRFGTRKGTGKGRGRTRGRPGKISVNEKRMKELESLGEEALGFLIRLVKLARHDTGLLAKRKKALSKEEIWNALKVPERTGYRRIEVLEAAGILEKTSEGYRVNKEFVRKE